MRQSRYFLSALLAATFLPSATSGCRQAQPDNKSNETASSITDVDRQIFEIVLADAIASEEFVTMANSRKRKQKIVLAAKTAGSSGLLLSDAQIRADTRDDDEKKIPSDVLADLQERNSRGSISLTEFRPASPDIIVDDVSKLVEFDSFEERYPDAKAFVFAWLPGYAKDGRTAILRFYFGPTSHGATGIYFLTKVDGKWTIKWRSVAHYS